MNYLYFQTGQTPKYLEYSIKSVLKSDPDANIYLASDQAYNLDNVQTVSTANIESERIKEIINLKYFQSWNNNPLWESSLLRIFYLYELANYLKCNSFVHFDSDVLLYKSFTDISENMINNKLNITPLTKDFLVFGYSYIDNLSIYDDICESVLKIYKNPKYYEENYYEGKKIIEMKALYIAYHQNPEWFNLLPIHPKDAKNFIFDPASYGQYIGGVDKKMFSKKFIDGKHLVSSDLRTKVIKPKITKNIPSVGYEDKNFDLVNLHVHSKKLKNYFPKG